MVLPKSSLILLIVLFTNLISIHGQKVDKIYLNNGDIITCEVKYLQNNLLYVKTDHSGNYDIEWDKIDSLTVKKFLRIEVTDGRIYYGSLITVDSAGYNAMVHMGGIEILNHNNIVSLVASKDKFLDRFDGSVSAGYSYTKASQVGQVNFSGNAKYQAPKYGTEIRYSNIFTKTDTVTSQTMNGSLTLDRILPQKWFVYTSLSLESNSEQNLKLRTNLGFGGGNKLVYTNFLVLSLTAGTQFNREISTENAQNNAEAILRSDFSVFRYDSPKINLTFSASVIPSLSDWGRIRTELDSKLRWEILSDFFISWTLGHRFDSRPLSATAARTDYWVVLGLEFTF